MKRILPRLFLSRTTVARVAACAATKPLNWRSMNDFRFVLRQLLRSPGFFAIAIVTLGLGIAANTTMFSLFYQVLLAALPVASPQQLFVFQSELPRHLPGTASSDNSGAGFSYPMDKRLRDGLKSFDVV